MQPNFKNHICLNEAHKSSFLKLRGFVCFFIGGSSDDDAGESFNFRIPYQMAAGEKVYLYVRGFSATVTGAYTVIATTE